MNKQGYMTIIRGFKTMKTWIEAHEGEKFTVFFASTFYNVPIKQDKNFEKLNEPDIIKNSKLSGKKVHKNG
ncbi:MAG TPA: hypothetical protein PKK61_04680 [Defluviitaleaceae bacterium]|nr:hypothetical protein [Defluviitaleaceae bacterium]